jgi:hypothetical protein
MTDFFYNSAGRLRSVWRLAAFTVAYLVAVASAFNGITFALLLLLSRPTYERLMVESGWGWVIQAAALFVPAALVGWACAYVLEDLPWRSLGWALHKGWLRDTLVGLAVGGASVCLAALIGVAFGGYGFSLNDGVDGAALLWTVAYSFVIFALGSAAEEMLFRGYPLQTLMRSWPIPMALVASSVTFAYVHMGNPNVARGFTFANTLIAGAWLAVSYWRTRSLWFPFALHLGWNFIQGAVLGSPVSGITKITPDPLLRFADAGPHWLGGGAYGIEGGAACTLALLLSTLFIWRTRLLAATPELRQFTDGENPNPGAPRVAP